MILALGAGMTVYLGQRPDATTLSGEKVVWDRGEQWRVINYFAPWCVPCLREIPELNHFHQSYGQAYPLYAVSYDPLTSAELKPLVQKLSLHVPVLDPSKTRHMPVATPRYLPATFIIAPDGSVAKTLLGEQTALGLYEQLETLRLESL
jgi:thiol-disulfide isomerase/thioredoxin